MEIIPTSRYPGDPQGQAIVAGVKGGMVVKAMDCEWLWSVKIMFPPPTPSLSIFFLKLGQNGKSIGIAMKWGGEAHKASPSSVDSWYLVSLRVVQAARLRIALCTACFSNFTSFSNPSERNLHLAVRHKERLPSHLDRHPRPDPHWNSLSAVCSKHPHTYLVVVFMCFCHSLSKENLKVFCQCAAQGIIFIPLIRHDLI